MHLTLQAELAKQCALLCGTLGDAHTHRMERLGRTTCKADTRNLRVGRTLRHSDIHTGRHAGS